MKNLNILDVKVTQISAGELARELKEDKKIFITKSNSEFLLRAIKNPEFAALLNTADLNIPDGVAVRWAAKYLSLPLTKVSGVRQVQAVWQMIKSGASLVLYPPYCTSPISHIIPGQECFNIMLEAAEDSKKGVYIFGAEKEILAKAIKELEERFPKLKIVGSHDGYSDKGSGVIEDINRSKAEILFVALGSPEQEYWIRDNWPQLKTVRIAVGEGGTLDFVAGASVRAPKCLNKLGLEWLWRLFFSPNRTTGAGSRMRRIWEAVPVFIFEVVKWKLRNGQTKFE